VQLEGSGQLKKSNDLLACSIVPQPATLPRVPINGPMQFPYILKQLLLDFFCSFKITFKRQITDYLGSAISPIHILHFDPCGLQCVHLRCTNSEQTKHGVKTFHCNCEFVLPRVPRSVSFTQKRGTCFKEIWYSFE
jgi:hypothetical protein